MARLFAFVVGLFLVNTGYSRDEDLKNYKNFKLMQIMPKNEDDFELMDQVMDMNREIEVLKHSHGVNDTMDFLVPPDKELDLLKFSLNRRLNVNVKITDYKKTLDAAKRKLSYRRSRWEGFDIFSYNNYNNILAFQNELQQEYPRCVQTIELGASYEGRPIRLTKISKNKNSQNPIIFIDAGVHAREWVAIAEALYIMEQVARSCQAGDMLNGVDWYILPVVNPDGYEFSRNKDRMWRKTRSRYVQHCRGVDGNRNYGYMWGVVGVSADPCEPQTYSGPKAFSEEETRIVRDVMLSNRDRIKLYVSLHSYGQYLLYPWGYTGKKLPERWQELDSLARKVSDAVVAAGGPSFRVCSAGKWYAAAGGSDDYAFAVAKIPFSYTMELTDGHQFDYPESKLHVALPQFYAGFATFAKHIAKKYGG